MQKLLSLPPNLVNCFYEITGVTYPEWFCTSDPVGAHLGSGGGTTWLLKACKEREKPDMDWDEWLKKEYRIL